MKYLVTGATGFLGRHLLTLLHQSSRDDEFVVLLRDQAEWAKYSWTANLSAVRVLQGDLTAPSAWIDSPLLQDLQGIYHLAALVMHNRRDAQQVFHVNVEGTATVVLVAARFGCRLVFVSTSGTVGCSVQAGQEVYEDAPYCRDIVGDWPYYASKICAEQRAGTLAKQHGVELVIVRPPMLLGPGDHRYRATSQVIRFLRRRLPFLIRGGIHYVDIRDAAQAITAIMQLKTPAQVYHLCGTACSIESFFQDLSEISGVPKPSVHLPFTVAWSLARANEWLGIKMFGKPLSIFPDPVVIEMAAHHWDFSSRQADRDLRFTPRAGRTTLEDTVHWLRENRADC